MVLYASNILMQRLKHNTLVLYSVSSTDHRLIFFQKDFRVQELPLARIKKIMKLDEDVKVKGQPK